MQYRLGTCSSCKARYKVPATFTAARARCKTCGGAVEFGAVQSDEPAAPQPAPRPAPEQPQRAAPQREPAPPPSPAAPIPAAVRPVRPSPAAPPTAEDAPPAQRGPAAPLPRAGEGARRPGARERAGATPARAPAAAGKPRNRALIVGAIVALAAIAAIATWFVVRSRSEKAAEAEALKKAQEQGSAAPQTPAEPGAKPAEQKQ